MIRRGTPKDIMHLVRIAHTFNDMHYDVPLDNERAYQFLRDLLMNPNGVVFITEDNTSAIVGVVAQDPMRDHLALIEIGWFASGGQGLRLLREFHRAAREYEVDEVRMTTLAASTVNATAILSKLGYEPVETSHRLLM